MYEVFVKSHFSAAHRLKDYSGNCARVHGHNWEVEARLQISDILTDGLTVDLRDLRKGLNEILADYDHTDLSEHQDFQDVNPSSELIAKTIFQSLQKRFENNDVKVARVEVYETPGCGAAYLPDPSETKRDFDKQRARG